MLYDYNQTKNNFFDSLYTTNNQTIQIILNCMENTLIYLFYNLINYFNDCNNLLSMIFEFKKCKKILISFNLL